MSSPDRLLFLEKERKKTLLIIPGVTQCLRNRLGVLSGPSNNNGQKFPCSGRKDSEIRPICQETSGKGHWGDFVAELLQKLQRS